MFISGILHVSFSDYGCLQVTDTIESETAEEEELRSIVLVFQEHEAGAFIVQRDEVTLRGCCL